MVAHHLGDMVEPVVLQERVHEQRVRILWYLAHGRALVDWSEALPSNGNLAGN